MDTKVDTDIYLRQGQIKKKLLKKLLCEVSDKNTSMTRNYKAWV